MLICGTFRGASERVSFGVRQLAAAFPPRACSRCAEGSVTRCASLLAMARDRSEVLASKLACNKAAASCRTPKLRHR